MCRHVVTHRKVEVAIVDGELDNRMEQVFEAASAAIFEATRELIASYANDGLLQEFAAAAVGKALMVNGVSAMAIAVGISDLQQILSICDDANELIACRLEDYLDEVAA